MDNKQSTLTTNTIASSYKDNTIQVITGFSDNYFTCNTTSGFTSLPHVIDININENKFNSQNDSLDGELILLANNMPSSVSMWVDSNGNLYISSEDTYSYSIDEYGNLLYDFCESGACTVDYVEPDYVECGYVE